MAAIAVFSTGLFWVAYATVNVAFKDQVLALKERNQYRARLEYEDRIGELRSTIDRLNRRLLLDQKAYLAKVDEVRGEHDQLIERHERLAELFQNGWLPSPTAGDNSGGASDINNTAPATDDGRSDPEKQGQNGVPRGTPMNDAGRTQLALAPPLAPQAYKSEFTTPEQVLQPLADLRDYMAGMESRETGLLQKVVSYMDSRNAELAEVYRKLGINAGKVASSSQYEPDAVGGPYIAAASQQDTPLLVSHVNELVHRLETWERLKYQAARLPLSQPMPQRYATTSGFGLRKDPFKHRPAMHAGIDFRGPVGTAVNATAPGVVIKAGWSGGYGKLVEIRHENGVTIRYALLSIIRVRAGQRVKRDDTIGTLGSTGRSIGPHLHYETRVDSRAIDPKRFWKARDVFQEVTK